MTLVQLHGALSQTTWLFFLVIGAWGVLRAARGMGVDGSYLGAMVIGELLFILMAVLGGILYIGGGRPIDTGIHVLYGAFALVFLPFVFMYINGDDTNRGQWIYAFSTLFLFGIALRSIQTGGVG
jgi:hypothetical protein